MNLLPLLGAAALLANAPNAQSILRVGPGQAYSTIQSAISAARPGDRILVTKGNYPEQLTIDKGLVIECGGSDVRGPIRISNLASDQFLHLSGAAFRSAYLWGTRLLLPIQILSISNCDGAVTVSDCSFTSVRSQSFKYFTYSNQDFVRVSGSRLNLAHCRFGTSYGGASVLATNARVTFTDCGEINAHHAYDTFTYARQGESPTLVANNSTIAIGDTTFTNASGLPGVQARGSRLTITGPSRIAGLDHDGTPTDAICDTAASFSALVGAAPYRTPLASITGPVGTTPLLGRMNFSIGGAPGMAVAWGVSLSPQLIGAPAILGNLVDINPAIVALATIPAAQQLQIPVSIPNVPTLLGATIYVQAATATPIGIGLSSVATGVVR